MFDTWRFHAFFTTADPDDPGHRRRGQDPPWSRGHRAGPRRPEGLRAGAPAVRGVHRQRGLAGARGHRVQPHPRGRHLTAPDLARATTATIRRKLITVPARVATSARRITLHLPQAWPWETAWTALFDRVSDPPSVLAA